MTKSLRLPIYVIALAAAGRVVGWARRAAQSGVLNPGWGFSLCSAWIVLGVLGWIVSHALISAFPFTGA